MWFLVTYPKLNLIAVGFGFYPLFSITKITSSSMTAKAALKIKHFAEEKENLIGRVILRNHSADFLLAFIWWC